MPLTIFYKDNETLADLGSIELDAVLNENQTFNQEATLFPVEDGSDIADNIRNDPSEITVDGLVSDTPVKLFANIDRLVTEGAFSSRSLVSYEKLLEIREKKALCDVVSALRLFSNMVMTSVTIPRSSSTGKALRFSATFRQVRIVNSLKGDLTNVRSVQNIENKAPNTQNGGSQSPAQVSDTDSFLFNTVVEPFL